MSSRRASVGRIQKLVEQFTTEILVQANIIPKSNGASSLGSDALRFSDIYCQDLNLANERGDYTIIEEPTYLSIRNNKTGKLYKFVLEEIETQAVDIVEEIHHIEEPPSAQPLVWTFATAQTRDSWTHARAKKRDPWTHARSQIS